MTKEEIQYEAQSIIQEWGSNDSAPYVEFVEKLASMKLPEPPSNLDEAAEEHSKQAFNGLLVVDNIDAFKAGAEWMAGQGWLLDGEVKDQPTGGDDFEIYLDYDGNKMEDILDEICDYVNANYPDDDNRYKVVVQIRKEGAK